MNTKDQNSGVTVNRLKYKNDCLHFNGARPCFPHTICTDCDKYTQVRKKILYIHTGAMGDIVRQMSLLRHILEANPGAKVSVLTAERAFCLFESVKEDHGAAVEMLPIESTPPHYFQIVTYDELYNLDRDRRSSAVATQALATKKYGFSLNPNGSLGYFNEEAFLIYDMGLNDNRKFYHNKLYADQLIAESVGLVKRGEDYNRPYGFALPKKARAVAMKLRETLHSDADLVVGTNIGVGDTLPYKNLTERAQVEVLYALLDRTPAKIKVLLLGGQKESSLVDQIIKSVEEKFRETGRTPKGKLIPYLTSHMIEGAQVIAALDLLLTSDTFALHLALSQDVPNLSWFGPTNLEEIRFSPKNSFYIKSEKECSPCWSPVCDKELKCNDSDVVVEKMITEALFFLQNGKFRCP